ncbi:MAG: hypothetical protein ACI9SE_004154 [Neolewinella sp.]|jgi:hypothetical protein
MPMKTRLLVRRFIRTVQRQRPQLAHRIDDGRQVGQAVAYFVDLRTFSGAGLQVSLTCRRGDMGASRLACKPCRGVWTSWLHEFSCCVASPGYYGGV